MGTTWLENFGKEVRKEEDNKTIAGDFNFVLDPKPEKEEEATTSE